MERPDVKYRVVDSQLVIDELLNKWKNTLGSDYEKYRNHVYRVFNYAWNLTGYDAELEPKLAIASAFHDIGIWSHRTFDYIDPSIQQMRVYLLDNELEEWQDEITLMIANHHKTLPYKGPHANTVEAFRRADVCDLSFGVMRFGIPLKLTRELHSKFNNEGFHWRLAQEGARNFMKNPTNPLPMFRW